MDAEPNTKWAVYLDYDIESMTYQPTRVVPYSEREYVRAMTISSAIDEFDAYRQCMEVLKRVDEGII